MPFHAQDEDELTWEQDRRIERICTRYEDGWRAGLRPKVEDFVEGCEGRERTRLRVELYKLEFYYRCQAGEPPSLAEYQEREPAFAPGDELFNSTLPHGGPSSTRHTEDGRLPVIPGYEVLGHIGNGKMGDVYKAKHLGLAKLVALKTIRDADYLGAEGRRRFREEAQLLAKTEHPNIVRVFDADVVDGVPYFAMELVEGGTLRDLLASGPVGPAQAAELVATLARAMHVAHEAGVIHRDLKPANILVQRAASPGASEPRTRGVQLKVADFGLAKRLDASVQTVTGAILGTPAYMAPEQARGDVNQIGRPTDVYALGAILFELLTGRPPFREAGVNVLYLVLHKEPEPPSRLRRGIPRDLEAVCLKCLEKKSEKRYPTALELAEDLERFLAGEPTLIRPLTLGQRVWRKIRAKPLVPVVVLFLLAALAALPFLLREPSPEFPDPEEVARNQLKADLAAGRTFHLSETAHLPGPLRQVLGKPVFLHRFKNDEISIASDGWVVWELVDDAMTDRYRLSVKVQLVEAFGELTAGICFGFLDRARVDDARLGTFFSFGLYKKKAEQTEDDMDAVRVQMKDDMVAIRVQMRARLFREKGKEIHSPHNPVREKEFHVDFKPGKANPWCHLSLVIDRASLAASCRDEQGQMLADWQLSDKDLSQRMHALQLTQLRDWPIKIPTNFTARSGVGLCVRGGRASFRDLTLQPLDE